ncbi:10364_t:CDS:2 [Dentiscutata erythropus]|uniref:10364_t:CDS:1 n=1 Tax=Dentiscutata erythropus TaxID=1348616 RepID=A0A9N9H6W9_9GLOM|nr:10364_t:CDS:2 [Dentiscutata erythropus]
MIITLICGKGKRKAQEISKADQYDEPETIEIDDDEYPEEEYINRFEENMESIVESSDKGGSNDLYRSDDLYESDNLCEPNDLYESDDLE